MRAMAQHGGMGGTAPKGGIWTAPRSIHSLLYQPPSRSAATRRACCVPSPLLRGLLPLRPSSENILELLLL